MKTRSTEPVVAGFPAGFPAEFPQVTLRDGRQVTLRPIRPDDAPRLQAFFTRLSLQSITLRFLRPRKQLSDDEARALTEVDMDRRMAFVGVEQQGDDSAILGVARYAAAPGPLPGVVEAAVIVQDDCQRQGLGSILLARLLTYAASRGITTVQAVIRAENDQILRFIRRSKLPVQMEMCEPGVWHIQLSLTGDLSEAIQSLPMEIPYHD